MIVHQHLLLIKYFIFWHKLPFYFLSYFHQRFYPAKNIPICVSFYKTAGLLALAAHSLLLSYKIKC